MAQQLQRDGGRASLVGIIDAPSPDMKLYRRRNGLFGVPQLVVQGGRHVSLILRYVWPYVRDGLFLIFSYPGENRKRRDPDRPSISDHLRWAWWDSAWQSLVEESDMKAIVSQNERLLLIRQPTLRRALRLLSVNMRSIKRYRPEVYPGRLVLFRAEEHLGGEQFGGSTMGWNDWAEDGVEIRTIPGNHMQVFRYPNIESLAGHLNECLDEVPRHG